MQANLEAMGRLNVSTANVPDICAQNCGSAWDDGQTLRCVLIESVGCTSLSAQCIAALALAFHPAMIGQRTQERRKADMRHGECSRNRRNGRASPVKVFQHSAQLHK